jgi:hypothetical protein
MSSQNVCNKCGKTFSNVGNLNVHKKTVCNDVIKYLNCEFCLANFKRRSTLNSHYGTCKIKLEKESNKEKSIYIENEQIKKELLNIKIENRKQKDKQKITNQKYETELKNTNQKYETELKNMNDKYTSEIKHLKDKLNFSEENSRKQINLLQEENKRLTELLSNLSDKLPISTQTNSNNTSTNTVINISANIFDQLNPITDETFFQYGQEITQKILLQGLDSVLNLGMKHFKDKVVCTDKSRNTLKYKMKDQIVNDKGGVRLAEQIINQSIEPKVKLYDKTLVDTYKKKTRDPTTLKYEQAQLNSMIELRNAIVDNDDELKTKIGSKLSKRVPTNHAMIADINGATTKNMWEFFNQADKSCERILFNSIEYFLVRDANKNVIRALEVDDDGLPILDTEIDFSAQTMKLLPPPTREQTPDRDPGKKSRGRPKKVNIPEGADM